MTQETLIWGFKKPRVYHRSIWGHRAGASSLESLIEAACHGFCPLSWLVNMYRLMVKQSIVWKCPGCKATIKFFKQIMICGCIHRGFHKWGYANSWMVYFMVNPSSLQLRGWGYGGPFCSELDSLSPKWFWERFSSLQNGMTTNLDPTKWCSFSTILDLLYPQRFWYFHPKMVKHLHSCSQKNSRATL